MRTAATVGGAWLAAALTLAATVWLVFDVIVHGAPAFTLDFLTQNPAKAGRAGGIFPVLVSTGWILVVCLAAALPLGVTTAVFLNEWSASGSRLAAAVQKSMDVLAAVPSVVFGLFGNAFFTSLLGLGYSILSGGLTLACMILPILIRTIQVGLQSLPRDVRLAAHSLGMRRSSLVFRVLVPVAMPSLVLGTVLGVARAMAETAALLFTAGYVDRLPTSVMDSGRALSIHIYELAMNVPGGNSNAYASAFVLIVVLTVMNGAAMGIGEWWMKKRVIWE